MSNLKNKYLKYKSKYLQLKKIQEGGKVQCDRAYNNVLGTCWAVAIQTMFTFGQATSSQLETILKSFKPSFITWYNPFQNISDSKNKFIGELIDKVQYNPKLNDLFPNNIYNFPNILNLMTILDKFIDRYYSKVLEFNYTEKPKEIVDEKNPLRCELIIAQNFKKLFEYEILKFSTSNDYGGNIISQYLFANLLSVFFLDYKVSFTNYYDNFNLINFDTENDLGILIRIENHVCCLYICDDAQKYYNDWDRKVYDCNWMDLLKKSSENNLYIEKGELIRRIKDFYSYEKKVLYLTVVSKQREDSTLDKEIKNILKFPNHDATNIEDSEIQYILGEKFYLDKGATQDYAEAARLYRLSAAQGNVNAQTTLGYMFQHGKGVAQDYAEAMRLYRIAAAQGDAVAQINLGYMFQHGQGVAQDYAEAVRLYYLAVEQKNAAAQYYLGLMFKYGLGVAQDYEEAIRLYRLSAEQNNANAQTKLGLMFYLGQGVAQDYTEAIRLFRLAAEQKNADAHYNLGLMFEKGQGVTQDYEEAMRLYCLAEKEGSIHVAEALKRMSKKVVKT